MLKKIVLGLTLIIGLVVIMATNIGILRGVHLQAPTTNSSQIVFSISNIRPGLWCNFGEPLAINLYIQNAQGYPISSILYIPIE